jgi:hypothetical protein
MSLAGLFSKHTPAGDLHHAIEEMPGRRPPRSPIPSPTVLKDVGPLHFTKTDDEPTSFTSVGNEADRVAACPLQ